MDNLPRITIKVLMANLSETETKIPKQKHVAVAEAYIAGIVHFLQHERYQ